MIFVYFQLPCTDWRVQPVTYIAKIIGILWKAQWREIRFWFISQQYLACVVIVETYGLDDMQASDTFWNE